MSHGPEDWLELWCLELHCTKDMKVPYVCVCLRACMRAFVRACMHACLLVVVHAGVGVCMREGFCVCVCVYI